MTDARPLRFYPRTNQCLHCGVDDSLMEGADKSEALQHRLASWSCKACGKPAWAQPFETAAGYAAMRKALDRALSGSEIYPGAGTRLFYLFALTAQTLLDAQPESKLLPHFFCRRLVNDVAVLLKGRVEAPRPLTQCDSRDEAETAIVTFWARAKLPAVAHPLFTQARTLPNLEWLVAATTFFATLSRLQTVAPDAFADLDVLRGRYVDYPVELETVLERIQKSDRWATIQRGELTQSSSTAFLRAAQHASTVAQKFHNARTHEFAKRFGVTGESDAPSLDAVLPEFIDSLGKLNDSLAIPRVSQFPFL